MRHFRVLPHGQFGRKSFLSPLLVKSSRIGIGIIFPVDIKQLEVGLVLTAVQFGLQKKRFNLALEFHKKGPICGSEEQFFIPKVDFAVSRLKWAVTW